MTNMQTILGNILRNRINSELTKEVQSFSTLSATTDIFLAADKITIEQYTELTALIATSTTTTASAEAATV